MDFFQEIHVFLQLTSIDLFGGKEAKNTLKHWNCRKYSFQTLTQFSQGNNVLDAPASKTDGCFLRGIHLFLRFSRTGLFLAKWAFHYLENYDLQEVFLSRSNSILPGYNVLQWHFLTETVFLGEVHVFLQLSWIGLFVVNRAYLHNETKKLSEVFLSKTTQCSQGNNGLCTCFSHIWLSFERYMCLFILSKMSIWSKMILSAPRNFDLQIVFLSNAN
jgi:hypothetical protein